MRLRISERLTTTADMTNIKDCNLNKALLDIAILVGSDESALLSKLTRKQLIKLHLPLSHRLLAIKSVR